MASIICFADFPGTSVPGFHISPLRGLQLLTSIDADFYCTVTAACAPLTVMACNPGLDRPPPRVILIGVCPSVLAWKVIVTSRCPGQKLRPPRKAVTP